MIGLTPAGSAVFGRLDAASSDQVAGMLRPPAPGDLGWVVQRTGALYAAEYGWDDSYEALVARIVADYAARADRAGEAAWIAEAGGERAGCVFCMRKSEQTAQLRLLLVEPPARGWRCADPGQSGIPGTTVPVS